MFRSRHIQVFIFLIIPTSINLDWSKINVKLSAEFKSDILGTLRYDIIERKVRLDNWILVIGSFMNENIKRKADKAYEV